MVIYLLIIHMTEHGLICKSNKNIIKSYLAQICFFYPRSREIQKSVSKCVIFWMRIYLYTIVVPSFLLGSVLTKGNIVEQVLFRFFLRSTFVGSAWSFFKSTIVKLCLPNLISTAWFSEYLATLRSTSLRHKAWLALITRFGQIQHCPFKININRLVSYFVAVRLRQILAHETRDHPVLQLYFILYIRSFHFYIIYRTEDYTCSYN